MSKTWRDGKFKLPSETPGAILFAKPMWKIWKINDKKKYLFCIQNVYWVIFILKWKTQQQHNVRVNIIRKTQFCLMVYIFLLVFVFVCCCWHFCIIIVVAVVVVVVVVYKVFLYIVKTCSCCCCGNAGQAATTSSSNWKLSANE